MNVMEMNKRISRRDLLRTMALTGATFWMGSAFARMTATEKAIALGTSCLESPAFGSNQTDSFILLKGGEVTIGSPRSERQRNTDEVAHSVRLSPFYIDPYEVTQKDYEAITGKNPSHFLGKNLPVENVTWYDAIAYCNALSRTKGLTPVYQIEGNRVTWNRAANGYRLLTEAEWEYAARAGSQTIFNAGNQITSKDANFQGHYPYLIEENHVTQRDPKVVTSSYRGGTIDVGSLPANAFGLYDMYGNVSEWCFDYYGNTERGAKIIAHKTGGDLFEIEMRTPYRGNIYEVSQKDLNQNIHPTLKRHVKNMDQYDVILLGYPTWWATMPMPVLSFLEEYDFSGKVIVSFSSHGGTGFGDSVSDLSKMLPKSLICQALEYHYSGGKNLGKDISQWLALNRISKKVS